jgi:hypothetical protein
VIGEEKKGDAAHLFLIFFICDNNDLLFSRWLTAGGVGVDIPLKLSVSGEEMLLGNDLEPGRG